MRPPRELRPRELEELPRELLLARLDERELPLERDALLRELVARELLRDEAPNELPLNSRDEEVRGEVVRGLGDGAGAGSDTGARPRDVVAAVARLTMSAALLLELGRGVITVTAGVRVTVELLLGRAGTLDTGEPARVTPDAEIVRALPP